MLHAFIIATAAMTASGDANSIDSTPLRFELTTTSSAAVCPSLTPKPTDHATGSGASDPTPESTTHTIEDRWALAMLQDDGPSQPSSDAILPTPFGSAGTWRFNVQAGAGWDIKRDNQEYLAGVSWSYFVIDDVSMELEFNGLFADQKTDNAAGFNFNLIFRWHFWTEERWSTYLDFGAGLLLSTDHIPQNGSSFNFTPQGGVGLTYALREETRLILGVRWHHISNANTFEDNPGRDSILFYSGLSFPF